VPYLAISVHQCNYSDFQKFRRIILNSICKLRKGELHTSITLISFILTRWRLLKIWKSNRIHNADILSLNKPPELSGRDGSSHFEHLLELSDAIAKYGNITCCPSVRLSLRPPVCLSLWYTLVQTSAYFVALERLFVSYQISKRNIDSVTPTRALKCRTCSQFPSKLISYLLFY